MTLDGWNSEMNRYGSFLNGLMGVLTPVGVVLGIVLGNHVSWMKSSVTYLFAIMTFSGALSISPSDFFRTLKKPKFLLCYVVFSIVLMPLASAFASHVFFTDSPDICSGYIVVRAIPTAVVGTIWASVYSGNMAIAISIVMLDTFIAPFCTPLLLRILLGTSVATDSLGMMKSLCVMVVIPSVAGMLCNGLCNGKIRKTIHPTLKPLSKFLLVFVVMVNCSQSAERLISEVSFKYIALALFSIFLCVMGYAAGYGGAKLMHFNRDDTVSLTFAIAMRNISAALVIATDYLPQGAILPVIFCILFQQMTGAVVSSFLFNEKKMERK